MANVDIRLGYKDSAWFTANATLVLKAGQTVYLLQTGTYKIGDGTTQLSALSFLGGTSTFTSVLKHTVKAGQAINKGQAVYVSSADGTNMVVSKASNVSEALSSKTMGLLETTLALNGQGYVITEGLLAGLNTNSATIGDLVWLGVNGDLIYGLINKPYAPANLVFIGIVTRVSATVGEIFVRTQNGFELKELHDIDLISNAPANNDVLQYESSTSLWKNKQIKDNIQMAIFVSSLSPSDATTYYFFRAIPTTTATNHAIKLGYNGTITSAILIVGGNTVSGSTESSTIQFRNITQATSSLISNTVKTNASTTSIVSQTVTGLNIPFLSTDDFCLEFNAATFATNPTAMAITVYLTIEKTS